MRTAAQILRDIVSSGVPDGEPQPGHVDGEIGTHRAAEILGVCPDTVRRMAARHRLPYVRIGSHLRFRESDVRALAERRRLHKNLGRSTLATADRTMNAATAPIPPEASRQAEPVAGVRG